MEARGLGWPVSPTSVSSVGCALYKARQVIIASGFPPFESNCKAVAVAIAAATAAEAAATVEVHVAVAVAVAIVQEKVEAIAAAVARTVAHFSASPVTAAT